MRLRKYTSQEDRTLIFCGPPWTNEEHNILSALELRLEFLKGRRIRYRLLIDLQDNVAASDLEWTAYCAKR